MSSVFYKDVSIALHNIAGDPGDATTESSIEEHTSSGSEPVSEIWDTTVHVIGNQPVFTLVLSLIHLAILLGVNTAAVNNNCRVHFQPPVKRKNLENLN